MDELLIDDVQFQEPQGAQLYPLAISQISPGTHVLHNWYMNWGPASWRLSAHQHKVAAKTWNDSYYGKQPMPVKYTVQWARNRIRDGLEKVGKGLVFVALPTFQPYSKNAVLLRDEFGFKLLGGKCYPNASYPIAQAQYKKKEWESPYSPDGYQHWIHLWVKDLKGLENVGQLTYGRTGNALTQAEYSTFPNCCGLRLRWSTADIKGDPFGAWSMNAWLAPCQIPAQEKFPRDKGWKRFARYKDFKWGINFDSPHLKGVQDCPHEFDLEKLEEWELAQPLPK